MGLINDECPKPSFQQFSDVESNQYLQIDVTFTQESKDREEMWVEVHEPGFENNNASYRKYFYPNPLVIKNEENRNNKTK